MMRFAWTTLLTLLLLVTVTITTASTTTQPPTPRTTTVPPTSPNPWYPTSSPYSSTGSSHPFPTSVPSSPPEPDRGTFWPWLTPSGILPSAQCSDFLNPQVFPDVWFIIWQTDLVNGTNTTTATTTVAIPNGYLYDYESTSQHTYYFATFTNYGAASNFWNNGMPASTARAWTQYGSSIAQNNMSANGRLLMLRYSYLWNDNRIPRLHSITAEWQVGVYYVTARSHDGEFRMITETSYASAQQAYLAATMETISSGERQWSTVKLYSNGYILSQSTTCRGSELEHLGAFQWLEFPQPYNRNSMYSSSSYYMLVSWRSLSGVRLERMQVYSDWHSATAAQAWVTWYSSIVDNSFYRATSVIYYNKYISSYGFRDRIYTPQLQQDYYWITGGASTSPPTSYLDSLPTSTKWADLTNNQQTFIIAYPTALVVAAVITVIITGCCLKRGPPTPPSSTSDVSPCYRRVTCVLVLLSIASLVLLIISMSLKNFNTVSVKYSSTIWAVYGPFYVFQPIPHLSWLPVYWNAKVMGIVAGFAMVISMIADTATIGMIKHACGTSTSRSLFLSMAAFISSLLACLAWIPVHIRVFDRNIEHAVLHSIYPPNTFRYDGYHYNYNWSWHSVEQSVGTSYILLCVTTVIQFINVIIMTGIHKKWCGGCRTTTQHQHLDNDGLQLVDHTSPYYYRDVPATPAPAGPAPYIYGVPASGSSAPPPFTFTHHQPQPSGFTYAEPLYFPPPPSASPVAEPFTSYQRLL